MKTLYSISVLLRFITFSFFCLTPLSVWLHSIWGDGVARTFCHMGTQQLMGFHIHCPVFVQARWLSVKIQYGRWLTTTFPFSFHPSGCFYFIKKLMFSLVDGQRRNLDLMQTLWQRRLLSPASFRTDVTFGNALILTRISDELLMANRVRVCF